MKAILRYTGSNTLSEAIEDRLFREHHYFSMAAGSCIDQLFVDRENRTEVYDFDPAGKFFSSSARPVNSHTISDDGSGVARCGLFLLCLLYQSRFSERDDIIFIRFDCFGFFGSFYFAPV